MGTTPTLALPYPEATDPADVPTDIHELATALDGIVTPKTLVDAKGDLIAATAPDTVARLPVGTDGQVLTVDLAQATGVKWAAVVPGLVRLFDSTLGATGLFDITSIPATYAALRLLLYIRSTEATVLTTAYVTFNGDNGANYDAQQHASAGGASNPAEFFAQTVARVGNISGGNSPAGAFSSLIIDIPNYAGTVGHKALTSTWAGKTGTSTGTLWSGVNAAFWRSTAAINRITLVLTGSSQCAAGSRATLYGLT